MRELYAAAATAVFDGEREAAAAAARQVVRVERLRCAALAMHFADQSSGGPKWSPEAVTQRTVVTELAVGAHLSEIDARRKVDTAMGLCGDFVNTLSALSDGQISYRHAEKIVQHGLRLPRECVLDFEDRILPTAKRVSVQRLDREARGAAEDAQAVTAVQRHLDATAERYLALEPAADGMAYLTWYLPAVEAVAIYTRATELGRSLKNSGDPRTLTQLRGDALADLTLNGETSIPGATRGIRPHVRVTVPALALLRRPNESAVFDGGAANLEGYGPIDDLTARELARDAPGFYRILTDPATGIALNYGRQRYKPPADLDELIRTARAECSFPLACTPSATADLDHTKAFGEGHETEFHNLSPLCRSHHKVKHHTEWRIEQHPGHGGMAGSITWTSPAGFAYTVEPTPVTKPIPQFTAAPPAGPGSPNEQPRSIETLDTDPGGASAPF
ncbi:hypothetical protein GCM10011399_07180 [Subtercola lobariae]|uniref:DUF222 domain-containing protein n=1 Tax=Subtercola lobariae TaxID=1588641 RepID=A0A917B1Z2_9MICO|nr:hypothetical protein GCM10011399_07180 [Subtercola lobariae]